MALSEDFIKAVDSGDVTMARIMLSDSMLVDLTLHDFPPYVGHSITTT